MLQHRVKSVTTAPQLYEIYKELIMDGGPGGCEITSEKQQSSCYNSQNSVIESKRETDALLQQIKWSDEAIAAALRVWLRLSEVGEFRDVRWRETMRQALEAAVEAQNRPDVMGDALAKALIRATDLEVENLRLSAEIKRTRSLLRWDIAEDDEGIIMCDGDQERRFYSMSIVDALRAENEKLQRRIHLFKNTRNEQVFEKLMQAHEEIEKLRAELRDADVMLLNQARSIRDYQDAAAALKETGDE